MNGKKERTDEKKSWDISNWGLSKEDIQQAQDTISQEHSNGLDTDIPEHETEK